MIVYIITFTNVNITQTQDGQRVRFYRDGRSRARLSLTLMINRLNVFIYAAITITTSGCFRCNIRGADFTLSNEGWWALAENCTSTWEEPDESGCSTTTSLCFLPLLLFLLLLLLLALWALATAEEAGQNKLTENPDRDFLISQQLSDRLRPAVCMHVHKWREKKSKSLESCVLPLNNHNWDATWNSHFFY